MANLIEGTNFSDTLTGTSGDDLIFGFDGNDFINGGGGNDTIHPGGGADTVSGGSGDDMIVLTAQSDLIDPTGFTNVFDGGIGTNTLVTELRNGDNISGINSPVGVEVRLWGISDGAIISNIQQVQVSNAADFILTVGTPTQFGITRDVTSTDFATSTMTYLLGANYDGEQISYTATSVAFNPSAGLEVDGTTYGIGDSFTTAAGGTITVFFPALAEAWAIRYTAPGEGALSVIILESTTLDEVMTTTAITTGGTSVDVVANLSYTFGSDLDLSAQGFTTGVRVVGSDNDNVIVSGDGNDTIVGGDGNDSITLMGGNNQVWAGAGDTGNDTIQIEGSGNNVAGGGAGNDLLIAAGDGNNTLYGGAGNDSIGLQGNGDNVVWAGSGNDVITIGTFTTGTGSGSNIVGGGAGNDSILVLRDGDTTIYGGRGSDTITITGEGDNIIFGGGLNEDLSMTENRITIGGGGDNEVFNGAGNDRVTLNAQASGNNTLWGGSGDDIFIFQASSSSGTIIFTEGNGNDTVRGLDFDAEQYIDLSDAGFTDSNAVLTGMTQQGSDVVLFVAPGQTVTFENMTLLEFQQAAPSDWLIL